VLRIFIVLKNPSPWPGFEPSTFGSSGQHTNHYTTKATEKKLKTKSKRSMANRNLTLKVVVRSTTDPVAWRCVQHEGQFHNTPMEAQGREYV
jgi:hypothetical protein